MHSHYRSVFGIALAAAITLSCGTIASAATIKSVQSGTATSTGNGTVTVTISSVDTSKSFLVFQTRHNNNRPPGSTLRGQLTSSTTVEFSRVTNETGTIDIQWYVAEFLEGVSVQRGSLTENASSVNVAITPVASLNQAFVLWSKSAISSDSMWGDDDPILLDLTSTSNLQMRTRYQTSNQLVSWQVVEFTNPSDIYVQRGSTSLTGTTLSVDATLSTPVNLGKAFVLVGYQNTANSISRIGRRLARARLVDTTTVRIDRDLSDASDTLNEISWQVVELRDGSKVQAGSVNFPSGTSQQTISITPVNTGRSIAFGSAQPACGQGMGKSSYSDDDVIGVASATFAINNGDVTARRSCTDGAADIGWFVVEFAEPCSAPTSPRAKVLMVVDDSLNPGASDSGKRCALYSWNLGVTLISSNASSSQFATAMATANVVYVSASASASQVSSKLVSADIGVIWETPGLDDNLKVFASSGSTGSGTAVNIQSACHYITSSFATGALTIATSSQPLSTGASTFSTEATVLAKNSGQSSPALVVLERRNKLIDDSRATGRRVRLPWGGSSFDFTALNTDGRLLMRRAVEWAAEADGTLGVWRFDETTGTVAADSSGNSRNGTLTNMAPASDWCKGHVDNALDFDGVNDTVVVPGTFPSPPIGTVSFFMEVPGAPSTHGRIFGTAGNWEVRHVQSGNPDGVPYGIVFDLGYPAGGANNVFITTTPVDQAGRWYHIAAVFNQTAGTYAVYVDGALDKSGVTTLVTESPGTLTIGTRTGTTDYFRGELDDLRIYDRELCVNEIEAIARARSTARILMWSEVRSAN